MISTPTFILGLTQAGRTNGETNLPDMAREDNTDVDVIKVEVLVQEYLAAQALKVLPQGEFGDAVNQFVSKDDKNAMDVFVAESLQNQQQDLLTLDLEDEDYDAAMEDWKQKREEKFQAGLRKSRAKRRYKPRPDGWDSEIEGPWEMQPEALLDEPEAESAPKTQPRGRGQSKIVNDEDDDVSMGDSPAEVPPARAPSRRAAAAKTTKAAPAKKAPPPRKAPARGQARGPFMDDDDDDDDMFVDDDDEPPVQPPKRAQPAKTTARARQTTLDFPQSQRPTRQAKKVLEISDDEISEEEAFHSLPSTRSRRR